MSFPLTPHGVARFQIINAENDSNGNPIYVGWAPPGTLDTDEAWLIVKFTWDANNALLTKRYANASLDYDVAWTDRGAVFYG